MSQPPDIDELYFRPSTYHDLCKNLAVTVALQTLTHPLDFVATLLDLGYEPFTPIPVGNLVKFELIENVQVQKYVLPSVFEFVQYVYSVDGFFGLYRGLLPRICCNSVLFLATNWYYGKVVSTFTDILRQQRLEDRVNRLAGDLINNNINDDELVDIAGLNPINAQGPAAGGVQDLEAHDQAWIFVVRSLLQGLSLYCGLVVSHPFHVITIRSYAQFVGREIKYNSIFGSIAEIWRNEGCFGFFTGLSERVSGHLLYFAYAAAYAFIIRKLFNDDLSTPVPTDARAVLTLALTEKFAGYYGAGSHMDLANRQIVKGTGLQIGSPPYSDYRLLWHSGALYNFEPRQYPGPFKLVNGQLKPSYAFGPLHPASLGFKQS